MTHPKCFALFSTITLGNEKNVLYKHLHAYTYILSGKQCHAAGGLTGHLEQGTYAGVSRQLKITILVSQFRVIKLYY